MLRNSKRSFILRNFSLLFRKDDFTHRLRKLLGFTPNKISLYRDAFRHKSSIEEEHKKLLTSNERLEYLGDAVLNLMVAEFLYKKFPAEDEGNLTQWRAKICSRQTLNRLGYAMQMDKLLEANKGIGKDAGIAESMTGNALEAFFGAIFLDRGYAFTKEYFIKKVLGVYLDWEEAITHDENFKSMLIEWAQGNSRKVEFKIINIRRIKGQDEFTAQVHVDGEIFSAGKGLKKKIAEQEAAKQACKILGLQYSHN